MGNTTKRSYPYQTNLAKTTRPFSIIIKPDKVEEQNEHKLSGSHAGVAGSNSKSNIAINDWWKSKTFGGLSNFGHHRSAIHETDFEEDPFHYDWPYW